MSTSKSQPDLRADSQGSIIKSTSILSLGTLTSRILGFLRDVVLARLLGTALQADAFFVAFKIPNLFRDLVGEGATNAAVVPVFSEYLVKKDQKAFNHFASVVFFLTVMILSVLTVLGICLAPYIVRLMVPGFMAEPGKLQLTIELTRWMFPYLFFIGLTAFSMGILFTFRSFKAPAFAPCLLNVSLIASALIAGSVMRRPVFGLVVGVLIGGILQFLIQLPSLFKTGLRLHRPENLWHPGARKIGRLLIPRLLGSGVYQLTVLIDTFCASLAGIVGAGGISAIYYSNRIIQFPMGIFGVALASAVLPSLSGLATKNDTAAVKKTIVFSLENIFFVMCPSTVILFLLAHPIIRVLFQRGAFDAYSTGITSWALSFYALGLFSFGGIKILVTAFHALQDTKTPVKVAAMCLCINAVLNFLLMWPFKIGGIALASAISGSVDFLVLFFILEKRLGGLNSGLLRYFGKVSLAAGLTGAAVFLSWHYFSLGQGIVQLIFCGIGGMIFYEWMCLRLNIGQAREIWQWGKAVTGRLSRAAGHS